MRTTIALLFVLIPQLASAQHERYELGRRLKRFEVAWEQHTSADARARALKLLPDVTPQFFGLKFGEAARTLDTARHRLQSADDPAASIRWLESLCVIPSKRILTRDDAEVSVVVRPFYTVATSPPTAIVTLQLADDEPHVIPLAKLPVTIRMPRPIRTGAVTLKFQAKLDGNVVAEHTLSLAHLPNFADRLAALPIIKAPTTLETATLKDRIEFLRELSDGETPETDFPLAAMLDEADSLGKTERYFTATRSGSFWLSVPVDAKRTQPIRLFVPKSLATSKPVPLVFALHGAGGTENLFFEGYGNGRIVRECEERGWLLVAPRSGFGSGPAVATILEALAARYPIDRKRVFIVGHSMGAAQTIAVANEYPKLFRGVAALGGGGRPKANVLDDVPVFIGVGDRDFALNGAKALAKALPKATYREYPGIEHLVIVREALPDVFANWDSGMPKN